MKSFGESTKAIYFCSAYTCRYNVVRVNGHVKNRKHEEECKTTSISGMQCSAKTCFETHPISFLKAGEEEQLSS